MTTRFSRSFSCPVDQQQRRDLLDLLLDRLEPDQVVVKGREDLVDVGVPALRGERDGGVRGQHRGSLTAPQQPAAAAGLRAHHTALAALGR
jgi:hypothetical protein